MENEYTTPGDCLSLDLEVTRNDAKTLASRTLASKIRRIGAIRSGSGRTFTYTADPCAADPRIAGELADALDRLDDFADGAAFVLGHNSISFDLPHLTAVRPGLRLLKLPVVDTLRLNPLAFPRNPYHRLVKHYQDGGLLRGKINDPVLDAQLTLDVMRDQIDAFRRLMESDPELLLAWHWLTTEDSSGGFDLFFTWIRDAPRPSESDAMRAIEPRMKTEACITHANDVFTEAKAGGWPLAYVLAWLSVAGTSSVLPPWVRHEFPEAARLLRRLRDTVCSDSHCGWCRSRHDAGAELKRWFGYDDFRAEPACEDGSSLQKKIVEAAIRGEHLLAILPTGAGKSLCYQIPALSRHDKTGALTVVVSPLVALMSDQVAGLLARGITTAVAINGLLSMPERADALDRVRLGDAGILIISPEQLRNRSVRRVLGQRDIGSWVLDEAHCISKWGHDFRPDYRYVGRFIKEHSGGACAAEEMIPPILCLTATAKPDVRSDIVRFFGEKVGVALSLFDGGASRPNLAFSVAATTTHEKLSDIHRLLMDHLPPEPRKAGEQSGLGLAHPEQPSQGYDSTGQAGIGSSRLASSGGAIVYSATRRTTEDVADFLRKKGLSAEHFHSQLTPDLKKSVQERFIRGELRVISATNAFGMGIDKPDVRLVIHGDIPGSLENYLQEAGRAGRDQNTAHCILLYTPEDVERQFSLSARSRLTQSEIQAVLKSLRTLDRKKRLGGEVVATSGEMLAEETTATFQRDSATDDTRVRTAISWLEDATLLTREENQVQIFPSSLRVNSVSDASALLSRESINDVYRRQLLSIVSALIGADIDDGISTDELMAASGLTSEKVCAAFHDLERVGIASNDTALTAFVHCGVERSSKKRLSEAAALETALIVEMRAAAPELEKGDSSVLHMRHTLQRLKNSGHPDATSKDLWRIVTSLKDDGRHDDEGKGSLSLRMLDPETVGVTLQRSWSSIEKIAGLRRIAAEKLLEQLLSSLPEGARGTDLMAESTHGKLLAALESDLVLKTELKNPVRLLMRALMWMNQQEVIRLNKGLAVFRSAMTIRLGQERRNFARSDYAKLKLHYAEQVVQIHVMAEYVERGLKTMADAVRLAMDYFHLERDEFIRRWLPDREAELARQTTPKSWQEIVEALNNPHQERIIADDRERTNVLVLAGPGSGKTRVLVHRIAYLVRVRRENPRGILALAYNRHAAVEIRRRLKALIGADSHGLTVLTCDALAMRLAGVSFRDRAEKADDDTFANVRRQAVALLKGEGLPPEEADEQREMLLAGFRWILVDEYQDIGPDQYELISALAGRSLQDAESKLSLFAVGDDDQNIYSFRGASVEFIRRFESDYSAKPVFFTGNYRSTAHIIDASNLIIEPAANRMKAAHPITIDAGRKKDGAGGEWEEIDCVGRGRVQILHAGEDAMTQAVAAMTELLRLASLDAKALTPETLTPETLPSETLPPQTHASQSLASRTLASNWNWSRVAVIAREWKYLEPVRTFCEINGIPVQMADERPPDFWRLRETRALIESLRDSDSGLIDSNTLSEWVNRQESSPWWKMIIEALDEYALEMNSEAMPVGHFREWLAEWGRDARRKQTGLLLLTAHRAKGLEFDHVAVLDGGWRAAGGNEDPDSPRRLYYVAMTRARKTLFLTRMNGAHAILNGIEAAPCFLIRAAMTLPPPPPELSRHYRILSMKDIVLGYAGRHEPNHAVHRSIARLKAGDAIQLRDRALLDSQGKIVGRLSKSCELPEQMKCVSARIAAILVLRREEEKKPEYMESVRCETWETVLPELVFERD